ncbi:MAG: hypothetical protein ACK40O_03890 [Allosphingosinicella sp.]
MKKIAAIAMAAGLLTQPALAADFHAGKAFADGERGAFAGLRLRAEFGGPRTVLRGSLAVAPTTHDRRGANSRMTMGEGLELRLSPGSKAELTLAGQRFDRMSLVGEPVDRQNVSTVAKVAIAAGVVIIVGGLVFGHLVSNASCFHGERDCS